MKTANSMLNRYRWLALLVLLSPARGQSGETQERICAGEVMARLDRFVPDALDQIADGHWSQEEAKQMAQAVSRYLERGMSREHAVETLVLLGRDHPGATASAVPALVGLLGHPGSPFPRDERLLCEASRALGIIGREAGPAVQRLRSLRVLDKNHYFVSVWAASALARIDPEDLEALNWFGVRLRERPDPLLLLALAEIGAGAKPLVPQVRRFLENESGAIRVAAAAALWQITKSADQSMLDVLSQALVEKGERIALKPPIGFRTQCTEHRALAAGLLGTMGNAARPALPALERAEKSGDDAMRFWAGHAIWRIRSAAEPEWSENSSDRKDL